MNRAVHILLLTIALGLLAPGAWLFWRFAAWRSRIQTKINNLKAGDE